MRYRSWLVDAGVVALDLGSLAHLRSIAVLEHALDPVWRSVRVGARVRALREAVMTSPLLRHSQTLLRTAAAKVKVSELLVRKPQGVWTIAVEASVFEAIHSMAEHSVGALPAIDEGRMVGIITERDYARKLILSGKSSLTTTVAEVMSTNLITVTEEAALDDCMTLMTSHRIRHLPVLQNGTLFGILSIGDLVQAIILQQQQVLEELERYVAG